MIRASGKIKDFVELQTFEAVQNFATEPARSLSAYRFTDATSDLLARWLDALADLSRPPAKQGAPRRLSPLALFDNHLAHALGNIANATETDAANAELASINARSFAESKVPDHISRSDVQLIERALHATGTLPPVCAVMSAHVYGLLMRDELAARLQQWLDDIPEQSALVEVVRDENTGT